MDYVNSMSKMLHVASEDNPHLLHVFYHIHSNLIIVNGKGALVH